MEEAKGEALSAAHNAVAALNDLGFSYRLIEGSAPAPRAASAGGRTGTRTVKNEPCPICNFLTSPPHDRRAHRSQEPKRAFTAEELSAKGLTKV